MVVVSEKPAGWSVGMRVHGINTTINKKGSLCSPFDLSWALSPHTPSKSTLTYTIVYKQKDSRWCLPLSPPHLDLVPLRCVLPERVEPGEKLECPWAVGRLDRDFPWDLIVLAVCVFIFANGERG